MRRFLSEECIDLHKEYLNQKKIRYSVFEICYPELKNRAFYDLYKLRLCDEKEKIIRLKGDIILHDSYFSSFKERYERCENIRNQYKTEAAFLYEFYNLAIENEGFAIIYIDKGKIKFCAGEEVYRVLERTLPVLSLDLCEHAYFEDYHFCKEKYLENAISYLNLVKIDEKISAGH